VILNTNGLSALAEGEPVLESILRKATQVAIPVIVLGEYRYGISRSRYRKHYEQWLSEYLSSFRILDVDERTAVHDSAVRTEVKKAGNRIPSNDVWIAALCRQYPLLSRDRHFDACRASQGWNGDSVARAYMARCCQQRGLRKLVI
jgi:predicted nucleic acid-binding protein